MTLIKNIEAYVLCAKLEKPFGYSQGWFHERKTTIVKITTDDGIVGWGECLGPAAEAISVIVEKIYKPLLINTDPFDNEVTWEKLYNLLRDHGQKGLAIEALSGIDIALWDIIGKTVKKSIHKLIGGSFRTRVKAYATGLYFRKVENLSRTLAEEAAQYLDMGFKALKMKIGFGFKQDIENVKTVRETIGSNIMLMVDANHAYNTATAIRIGRELEKYDIYWFEEPVPPEDINGYIEVKKKLKTLIAGGECEYTRYGFERLISRRAIDILQPDPCMTGGISEVKKIIALALTHNIEVSPHTWGSSIALATSLHILAAKPDIPPSINPAEPLLEFDQTENPFRTYLAREPITIDKDGYVKVPTQPGLGIDIDENIIEKYRVK